MNEIKTNISLSDFFRSSNSGFYVNAEGLEIALLFYRDPLSIIDLKSALKTGQFCNKFSIFVVEYDPLYANRNSLIEMTTWLKVNDMGFSEFIKVILSGKSFEGLNISKSQIKAFETYSPFVTVPLPKKAFDFTKRTDVRKALLCGAFERAERTQRLTDDYLWDNQTDFGRGSYDLNQLTRKVVENFDRFRCYLDQTDKNVIRLYSSNESFKLYLKEVAK